MSEPVWDEGKAATVHALGLGHQRTAALWSEPRQTDLPDVVLLSLSELS